MPRKSISEAQITALTRHLVEHGAPTTSDDFVVAAGAAGLDPRTVRRAWKDGIKGRRPMCETFAESQTLARSRLSTEALKAERESAPLFAESDRADQLAREAKMSRAASDAVLNLLDSVAPLNSQVKELATSIAADAKTLPLADRLAIARFAVSVNRDLVATASAAMELERKRLGDPSTVTRLEVAQVPPSIAEVEHVVAAAARALERVRSRPAHPPAAIDGGTLGKVEG